MRVNKNLKLVGLLSLGLAIFSCAKDNVPATPPSSAAEITAFSFKEFPDAVAVFSGTNISVTLPAGTGVTKLVVIFTTTGASVKVGETPQVSGTTENDFTKAVKYVVIAKDGTTKIYTVTVSVQTATSKEITAFSFKEFPDAVAVFSGTNISVTLPAGTTITGLVATFSHTGSSVKVGGTEQKSGETANDFTSPVNYVVTDKNGDAKTYSVTVIVPKLSDKEITEFYFTGLNFSAIGEINKENHTITVNVKTNTDVTALKAVFTTTGVSVKVNGAEQASGTMTNDFTSAVTYTVTAQNNTTRNYTVTVTPVAAKYVIIPDANFLAFLKGYVPNAFGIGENADKLNIYHADVIGKTTMDCSNRSPKIVDLTGIEYFVGLTELRCYSNSLTSLDVSKNIALTELNCYDNKLTSLDVSKNAALTRLDCSFNSLESLDVSQNTALTDLNCYENPLGALDVSQNTALTLLACYSNSLTSLDVSQNTALTELNCYKNSLTNLDLSKNNALMYLYCYRNSLTNLDISSQINWGNLHIYQNTSGENPITTLKVNVLQKDHASVKAIKTKQGSNVTISTYTTSSIVNDLQCTNYDPRDGQEKCLD